MSNRTFTIVVSEQQLRVIQNALRNTPSSVTDDFDCNVSEDLDGMIEDTLQRNDPSTMIHGFVI